LTPVVPEKSIRPKSIPVESFLLEVSLPNSLLMNIFRPSTKIKSLSVQESMIRETLKGKLGLEDGIFGRDKGSGRGLPGMETCGIEESRINRASL
jgi:hypothetical protein